MGVHSMEATSQSSFHTEPTPSYDECVALLVHAVDGHDETHLDEVASPISQLAVVIEL
jgi:hypothetical protein